MYSCNIVVNAEMLGEFTLYVMLILGELLRSFMLVLIVCPLLCESAPNSVGARVTVRERF